MHILFVVLCLIVVIMVVIDSCNFSLLLHEQWGNLIKTPDSKVHVANMGLTWVLSAPAGPHVDPMNFVTRNYPSINEVTMTDMGKISQ